MAEITTFQKMKALPWQFAGHVLTMVCLRTDFYGGAIFMFFLSELKINKSRIGMIISLLTAFGFLGLLFAPVTARFGFKRSYMSFVIGRLFFIAPLVFLPYIVYKYGSNTGFWLIVVSMSCFALVKTFGEVAWVPWVQEIVPDAVRGKFGAFVNVGTMMSSIVVTFLGGMLISRITGLTPYIILIYIGLFAGVLSIFCYAKMPGGAPLCSDRQNQSHFREMLESLTKDSNYFRYIVAAAIIFIGYPFAVTFVPLYLKEEVGLSSGIVVWLDIANMGGGMLSSYFWGWAADRYGSKPIMLMGCLLLMLFPVLCLGIPRGHILSIPGGFLVYVVLGVGGMAWTLGVCRYLLVTAMPQSKCTGYGAVFYANQTLAMCVGPLASGVLLDRATAMREWLGQYYIGPYTPIFALSFILVLSGTGVMAGVRRDNDMPFIPWIRMFIRRDILKVIYWLIRFQYVKSENARINIAKAMLQIENPLLKNEQEILQNDPSLRVRAAARNVNPKDEVALLQKTQTLKLNIKSGDFEKSEVNWYSIALDLGISDRFYLCWKKLQYDAGTQIATLLWKFKSIFKKNPTYNSFENSIEEIAIQFAKNDYTSGKLLLSKLIKGVFNQETDAVINYHVQVCLENLALSSEIDSKCISLIYALLESKLNGRSLTVCTSDYISINLDSRKP